MRIIHSAMLQELVVGVKLLRSRRELPAMVVAVAVGVGLTTTAYSFIQPTLLTPLPYSEPDRLVRLWDEDAAGHRVLSGASQRRLAEAQAPFQAVASYVDETTSLQPRDGSAAARVSGARVSPALFSILGVRASVGRVLAPEDRLPPLPLSIVVSARLVRQGLISGTPGETIFLNGTAHRVVGVMDASFWFPSKQTDYWVPIMTLPVELRGAGTVSYPTAAIARLPAGLTPAVASEQATAIDAGKGLRVSVSPYQDILLSPLRPALLVLQAASLFVLLLVWLNVGWLFLARVRRMRDTFATMRAMGAGSLAVLSAHMVAAAAVALLSTPLAVLLSWILLRLGLTLESGVFSEIADLAVTRHVVFAALTLALVTSVGASVPAAVAAARGSGTLAGSTRTAPHGRLFQHVTVLVQVSMVFGIAAQAILFAEVLRQTIETNVGLLKTDFVVFDLRRRSGTSIEPADELAQYGSILTHLERRGLTAALTSQLPLTSRDSSTTFGRRLNREHQRDQVRVRAVTPGYFALTGTAAIEGRILAADDAGQRHAVVSDTYRASSYMRGASAGGVVGSSIGIDSGWRIVGVTPDVRQRDFYEPPLPEAYVLLGDYVADRPDTASRTLGWLTLLTDARRGTSATIDLVRAVLSNEMPDVEIRSAAHMKDLIAAGLGPRRLAFAGASILAVVALLLAAVGVHGIVSHSLNARGREIGIRMALGATPGRIAFESAAPLVAIITSGTTIGVAVLFAMRSGLQSVMVPPPGAGYPSLIGVLATAALVVFGSVAAACYRPIRTAASVDPAVSLRAE